MKNTYKLTEGAILLAIFAVLFMIAFYNPVLSIVLHFFLAFPFILFGTKYDRKSTAVFTLAGVLISMFFGSFLAMPLAMLYATTGAVMGVFLREGKSRFVVTAAGSFVFLVNIVGNYAISVAFFDFNFIKVFIELFQNSMQESVDLLKEMGRLPDEKMLEQYEKIPSLLETLVPSMFVLSSFLGVYSIQLVSMPLLRRLKFNIPKWAPFRELTLPKSILWYYLITMILAMILSPEEGTYWFWVTANLSFILQMLLVLQGLSFVFYITNSKGYPKAVPIIITVLLFLMPFILSIVRILGIIDLGFDLRKRISEK